MAFPLRTHTTIFAVITFANVAISSYSKTERVIPSLYAAIIIYLLMLVNTIEQNNLK
jgi:hypothetical protein